MKSKLILYQTNSGAVEIIFDGKDNLLYLTQGEVSKLFDVKKAAISKHVKNIFDTKELNKTATVSKMETVQNENGRQIKRQIEYYNLDLILSIGYRVNSFKATEFRQWATKVLKQHIIEGYTLNKKRLNKNYKSFLTAVDEIKKFLPANQELKNNDLLELIKMFASTWLYLDSYDKSTPLMKGNIKNKLKVTASELNAALIDLKIELFDKGEASELFGQDKFKNSIEGILGNVFQSFAKKELYPTIEEKATNLLYFIVKNHPFTDGNKRSGAFAFVWFLQKARILDFSKLSPEALTALTVLVAESETKNKKKIIRLILMLITHN